MRKINKYLSKLTLKYLFINALIISVLIIFINILEISRIIDKSNNQFYFFLYLSILKLPSVINETIPFIVVISISFLYRNLISNNELISMRNIGFSIFDIFKPIALAILFIGFIILIFVNPLSAKFEKKFDNIKNKDFSDMYSIKIINNELWIKNIKNENEKYFINISDIDLKKMEANNIKIISLNVVSGVQRLNCSIKEKTIFTDSEGYFPIAVSAAKTSPSAPINKVLATSVIIANANLKVKIDVHSVVNGSFKVRITNMSGSAISSDIIINYLVL